MIDATSSVLIDEIGWGLIDTFITTELLGDRPYQIIDQEDGNQTRVRFMLGADKLIEDISSEMMDRISQIESKV